jgi:hypothetical protein
MPSNPIDRRKPKGAKGARARKGVIAPKLLVIGIVLAWAALNEPAVFNLTSLGVWVLSALTTGLLAYAALTLVRPVFGLAAAFVLQTAAPRHDEANEP